MRNTGKGDMEVGEDAHVAALDHVLAEPREVPWTRAARIDRGRDARAAAEFLSVDAEWRAAPVDMRVQIDQSGRDDRAGHIANVGVGIRLQPGSDPGDFTLRERDIAHGVELLRRIDHAASPQDEVVSHSGQLPG
jgi:hypothetical protein